MFFASETNNCRPRIAASLFRGGVVLIDVDSGLIEPFLEHATTIWALAVDEPNGLVFLNADNHIWIAGEDVIGGKERIYDKTGDTTIGIDKNYFRGGFTAPFSIFSSPIFFVASMVNMKYYAGQEGELALP